jgi:MoxR-like ATPase
VVDQRTGRVDRIGSKAQRDRLPVVVYLPYLARTADERQYRVMRDRQRWFEALMGAERPVTLWEEERDATRVPLPDDLAARLRFDLSVR